MTYEHLTGRLVETQRSMLGGSAIDIARSVDGVTVTDDGNVTGIEGDGREVVDRLARRYIDVLGDPAKQRLTAAAREFEDELVLPPVLGGPEEIEEVTHPGPRANHGPAAASTASGAVSDGGTVTLHSPTPSANGEFSSTVEPTGGETSVEPPDSGIAESDDSVGEVETHADEQTSEATAEGAQSGPTIVRYTVSTDLESRNRETAALESVYLLPTGESGWQVPVSVADAVVEAVTEATDLDDEQRYRLVESIDTARLLATLAGDNGETVSFHEADVTVTFHRTGSLAVH